MYAARWPDDIRGDRAWDHPEWHYINAPLTRDGVSGSPPAAPNILTALEQASEVLQKPSSTDAEKAVALCWVFHLVGDVHQPLHAVKPVQCALPRGGPRRDALLRAGRPGFSHDQPPLPVGQRPGAGARDSRRMEPQRRADGTAGPGTGFVLRGPDQGMGQLGGRERPARTGYRVPRQNGG